MENFFLSISKEALLLIIILSAPAIFVSLIVGLTISLFQATTQIQDQALTFVPKLIAVMLTLIIFGTWGAKNAINFANDLLGKFHTVISDPDNQK